MLNEKWLKIIKKLDFAFQPIVNIKSGEIYAVEALLRNVKEAGGFHSIFNLFDDAFHDGILYQLDLELRHLAIQKFSTIDIKKLNIFYNLDNRILYTPDFKVGNTELILEKFNLDKQKYVSNSAKEELFKTLVQLRAWSQDISKVILKSP